MSKFTATQKRAIFKSLHEYECFVMPNPWDIGGAKLLATMGFKAVATTSAGYAWSAGKMDGALNRAEVLAHMRVMTEATDLPVNADFESGFAGTLQELEDSIYLAIETGVAGLSLEDATGNVHAPLMNIEEAAARISIARTAIDKAGGDTLLVGRAENFFVGVHDLDDTIIRLKAYAEAGADCLYAPGIKTREQIKAVVAAVAPKPVNVLIGWNAELTVNDLAELGVRRISVGGALARSAWHSFMQVANGISKYGRFEYPDGMPTGAELNKFLK